MTGDPERDRHDHGPRFDAVDQQERAYARHLKLFIGILVGPSAVLAALGFYDLAASVLLYSIFAAAGVVVFYLWKGQGLDL